MLTPRTDFSLALRHPEDDDRQHASLARSDRGRGARPETPSSINPGFSIDIVRLARPQIKCMLAHIVERSTAAHERDVTRPAVSALVTGHTGFTGTHLANHLEAVGYRVAGVATTDGGDIRDARVVLGVVHRCRPAIVFHLAGAPKSSSPQEQYSVSLLGTVSLLDAALELDPLPVVVLVSSSAVYGDATSERPIGEGAHPRPVTHYGVSKLAQEEVALRYFRSRRLPVVIARTFNLLGPGLPIDLACGAFVDAIVRVERAQAAGPVRTGNLRSSRDFTDVRDAVRAYTLLAEHGRAGVIYNVCTGRAVSLQHCMETLVGLSTRPVSTALDPDRMQADDVDRQVGDCGRLTRATGWRPLIPVEQSLSDMLDYARGRQQV